MGYLTGARKATPLESAEYGVWEAKISTVMAWLINFMDQKISQLYLFYQTARGIFDFLQMMGCFIAKC